MCVIADVLLCHDDELEGRRIAFILYLVPPWEKSDGGTLDLFSTDGKGLELSLGTGKDEAYVALAATLPSSSTRKINNLFLIQKS